MAVLKLKNEITNEWEDVITIKGDKGDKPTHEIDGTKIRFQNPDGSWGDWIELEVLTAERVPTRDGSNVQNKLDNSFSLGTDSEGNPYVQKKNTGMIDLLNGDADKLIYAGDYFIYGTGQKGTPTVNGWYINVLVGDTNDFCTQVATVSSGYMTFRRTRVNGVFGNWKLIDGELDLWSVSTPISAGIILLSQSIRLFNRIKIYTSNGLWLEGVISHSDNSARLQTLDTYSNAIYLYGVTLLFNVNSNEKQVNIYRSFFAASSATPQALAVSKIVGLP